MKMEYTAAYVRNRLNAVKYRLPKEHELTEMLRARKFAPMEIALQRYVDFVTGDLEGFLKYLRVINVKGIMFSYKYYTQDEVANFFKVEDGDRTLFGGPPPVETSYYGILPGMSSYVKREYKLSNSCYSMYISYTKFVQENIDLSHPKELRLYALVEGKVVACQLADVWLERLNLLNRAEIRNNAMALNLGRGELSFYFFNSYTHCPEPELPGSEDGEPEMPTVQTEPVTENEQDEPEMETEEETT